MKQTKLVGRIGKPTTQELMEAEKRGVRGFVPAFTQKTVEDSTQTYYYACPCVVTGVNEVQGIQIEGNCKYAVCEMCNQFGFNPLPVTKDEFLTQTEGKSELEYKPVGAIKRLPNVYERTSIMITKNDVRQIIGVLKTASKDYQREPAESTKKKRSKSCEVLASILTIKIS